MDLVTAQQQNPRGSGPKQDRSAVWSVAVSRLVHAFFLAFLSGCLSFPASRKLPTAEPAAQAPPAARAPVKDALAAAPRASTPASEPANEPDDGQPDDGQIDDSGLDGSQIDDGQIDDGGLDRSQIDDGQIDDGGLDDGELDSATATDRASATERPPHPFAELDDAELEQRLRDDPDSLGAMSLGRPGAGALFGGQQMESSDRWHVVNPRETWGTPETIEFLVQCIDRVHEQFPNTPSLPIGDISVRSGGHLAPHVSHQSGRDVDVGYYYRTPERWYTRATQANLDLARTWALVRAMVTETDVEIILIDREIQTLLRDYATSIGESPEWLDQLFGGPTARSRSLIRHASGHATHIHVRFYNPVAQESGRRMYRMLIAQKHIEPPTYFVQHKVRRGDTLLRIARAYKTKVDAIKRANRLRSNRIVAGRSYRIPRRGGVNQPRGPLVIPARRLPPPGIEPVANTLEAAPASPGLPADATPAGATPESSPGLGPESTTVAP